jgi:hypothetical protein
MYPTIEDQMSPLRLLNLLIFSFPFKSWPGGFNRSCLSKSVIRLGAGFSLIGTCIGIGALADIKFGGVAVVLFRCNLRPSGSIDMSTARLDLDLGMSVEEAGLGL